VTVVTTDMRFRRLYDEHHRSVLAYFLRRTDRDSAYECTEDVYLVAWRKIDDVPEGDNALPWLYGVCWRVLANHRRKSQRHLGLVERLRNEPRSPVSEPETVIVRNDEEVEMLTVLGELRVNDREVLRLAIWEELPHDEIAEILGCSTNAVNVRLCRAIQRLRKGLAKSRHRTRGTSAYMPGEEQ
jgi:RNA polymerase sigma factor (sigma-70 family)